MTIAVPGTDARRTRLRPDDNVPAIDEASWLLLGAFGLSDGPISEPCRSTQFEVGISQIAEEQANTIQWHGDQYGRMLPDTGWSPDPQPHQLEFDDPASMEHQQALDARVPPDPFNLLHTPFAEDPPPSERVIPSRTAVRLAALQKLATADREGISALQVAAAGPVPLSVTKHITRIEKRRKNSYDPSTGVVGLNGRTTSGVHQLLDEVWRHHHPKPKPEPGHQEAEGQQELDLYPEHPHPMGPSGEKVEEQLFVSSRWGRHSRASEVRTGGPSLGRTSTDASPDPSRRLSKADDLLEPRHQRRLLEMNVDQFEDHVNEIWLDHAHAMTMDSTRSPVGAALMIRAKYLADLQKNDPRYQEVLRRASAKEDYATHPGLRMAKRLLAERGAQWDTDFEGQHQELQQAEERAQQAKVQQSKTLSSLVQSAQDEMGRHPDVNGLSDAQLGEHVANVYVVHMEMKQHPEISKYVGQTGRYLRQLKAQRPEALKAASQHIAASPGLLGRARAAKSASGK